MTETQTKLQSLPLRLHSRVRVVSVNIRAGDSPTLRYCLLKRLGHTGIVVGIDPRFTLSYRVKLDNAYEDSYAEENLEVLKL